MHLSTEFRYTASDHLQIDPSQGGEDWFSSRHDCSKGSSGSILRFLHYPAVKMDESKLDTSVDIRAGAHSDYGTNAAIPIPCPS